MAEAVPEVADAAGISAEQIQEQAERLLRREQPGAMGAARSELVDALRAMVTGSEQEAAQARERAATIIAQQAGISPEEANQRLDQLQAEVQQRTEQVATQATEAADAAASATATASIWAFVAFVLGAGAAALGGAMGTRTVEHAY
jgi:demethoxyubiquinone hydroxylase (CLK1/Coq7/Cat5 family)